MEAVKYRPQRVQVALWGLVMAIFFVTALSSYGLFQVGAYNDDAAYAVLAQSFFGSALYGLVNLPGAPGVTQYPFGYPLLLAPLALASPLQPFNLAILSLVATTASGILLFWGWRTFSPSTSYWWGLSVAALFLFAPLTISHTQMVMSEAAFTLCALAAILLSSRPDATRLSFSTWLALSVLLVFVLFVRTVGITLIVAIFLVWGMRGRARAVRPIILVIAGMALVTAVILLVTVVRPADLIPFEYLRFFRVTSHSVGGSAGAVRRLLVSVREYMFIDGRNVILPLGGGASEFALTTRLGMPWLTNFVGFVLFALVAAGMWLWFRREGPRIPLVFTLIYLTILLVWSVPATRFFHPLEPQIFLAFLLAVSAFIFGMIRRVHLPARVGYAALGVIVVVLCALNLVKDARADESKLHTGDLILRTAWVRASVEPDAVIITEHPEVDFLYGNHKTAPYNGLGANDNSGKIRYVLLAPDIIWQQNFLPTYDARTQEIWDELQALAQQGKAILTYQDTANAIRVYKLTP